MNPPLTALVTTADAAAYAVSAGRVTAAGTVIAGVLGVVLGLAALRRMRGGDGVAPPVGRAACAVGAVALLGATVVLVTADGGVGSGNGVAGAILGLGLGGLALALGGAALARGRSRATQSA